MILSPFLLNSLAEAMILNGTFKEYFPVVLSLCPGTGHRLSLIHRVFISCKAIFAVLYSTTFPRDYSPSLFLGSDNHE